MTAVRLIEPSLEALPGYRAALERGWPSHESRDRTAEELAAIRADEHEFVAEARRHEGGSVTLDNGSVVPRLPGRTFWPWDGEVCGGINIRVVPGTLDLPPHTPRHVGYGVVPWKRNLGYATQALAALLPVARKLGLSRVSVACDVGNVGSRRVIEKNGGVFAGERERPDRAGELKLLFWIDTVRAAGVEQFVPS